jgi:hypothetical protein
LTRQSARVVVAALAVCAGARSAAAAGDDSDGAELGAAAASDGSVPEATILGRFFPAPVDGPGLRLPESPTRLYVDGAFASSQDLSALPYIEGKGTNLRFALGGAWRKGRFTYEAEIPFTQVTTLDVTMVPGGTPTPEKQTATSFGDVRLGAQWTVPLVGQSLEAGFGLRTRLATHTTHFQFYLPTNDELVSYVFPYYFHVEPTVILGGAIGRFIFVVNEGALVLVGPNGDFLGMEVVVPNLVFWDSHVAVAVAPWDFLGASVELGSDLQLNTVNDPQFPINSLRSVWVAPAVQLHYGDYRVDVIARLGIGRGAEAFGVLDYTGTSSYTIRIGRSFN